MIDIYAWYYLQAVEALERGASYDTFVCAAGYLIGEYSTLLNDVAPLKQFKLLHDRFLAASQETKVKITSRRDLARTTLF